MEEKDLSMTRVSFEKHINQISIADHGDEKHEIKRQRTNTGLKSDLSQNRTREQC
jgi:hypothetical protein